MLHTELSSYAHALTKSSQEGQTHQSTLTRNIYCIKLVNNTRAHVLSICSYKTHDMHSSSVHTYTHKINNMHPASTHAKTYSMPTASVHKIHTKYKAFDLQQHPLIHKTSPRTESWSAGRPLRCNAEAGGEALLPGG